MVKPQHTHTHTHTHTHSMKRNEYVAKLVSFREELLVRTSTSAESLRSATIGVDRGAAPGREHAGGNSSSEATSAEIDFLKARVDDAQEALSDERRLTEELTDALNEVWNALQCPVVSPADPTSYVWGFAVDPVYNTYMYSRLSVQPDSNKNFPPPLRSPPLMAGTLWPPFGLFSKPFAMTRASSRF